MVVVANCKKDNVASFVNLLQDCLPLLLVCCRRLEDLLLMEDPARRNYFSQFSCFSNTQYNRPKNGLSHVSRGIIEKYLFPLFLKFILSATALCGWEGVAGVWNCYQSRSKDKLLESQMWQRGNSLWGQASFKICYYPLSNPKSKTHAVQNVYLRFCRMYFSISVACIFDSLWGQALL